MVAKSNKGNPGSPASRRLKLATTDGNPKVGQMVEKAPPAKPILGEIAISRPSVVMSTFHTIPYNPSVLVTRKGLVVFDRMKRDDQIKAALAFKKMSVLSTGWEVVSPDGQDEDWEVTRFVRAQFEGIHGSMGKVLLDILSALDYGYSVSEKVFFQMEGGEFDGRIGLKALKTKTPHAFDFDTDEFGTLKEDGLVQRIIGKESRLPIDKFVIYSYQAEFGNVYGRSDLEAAYRSWWVKENAYKWLAMLLERFGIPPIFALYNPNALTPAQINDLTLVIQRLQASTAGALPRVDKDDLELWAPELAGQVNKVFLPALDMFNKDISRALLMPGLLGMTPDTQQGSFARSKVHFDVFLLMILWLQKDVQNTVVADQIVRQIVDLNYVVENYPIFRFLPITDKLRLDIMEQWGKFVEGSIVKTSDKDEEFIRNAFGFPERDEGEEEPEEEEEPEPEPEEEPEGEEEGKKELPLAKPEKRTTLTLNINVPGAASFAKDADDLGGPQDNKPSQSRASLHIPGDYEDGESFIVERSFLVGEQGPELFVETTDLPRAPNRFEKKVDFVQVERTLNEMESRAIERLVPIILDIRTRFLKFIETKFNGKPSFVKEIKELRALPKLRREAEQVLLMSFDRGAKDMSKEIGVSKKFVDIPNFRPTDAIRFLKGNADFFVTGINDDLTKKARVVLTRAIETGEPMRQTMDKLRRTFEPYVGDPKVIRDGKVVSPARLETIVRTNQTDAYNRGRLVQARQAGELVHGFEYSAIIDGRTTEVCRHLDGKIFRADDPSIDRLKPPRHFSCRSILVAITIDEEIDEDDFINEEDVGKGLGLSGEGFGGPPRKTGAAKPPPGLTGKALEKKQRQILGEEFGDEPGDEFQYNSVKSGLDDVAKNQKMTLDQLKASLRLNEPEMVALHDYTQGGFRVINSALREGKTDGIKGQVDIMVGALKKLPTFKGVVYRSASTITDSLLKQYRVGKVIQDAAFLSTSTDTALFGPASRLRYVISSKTGRSIRRLAADFEEAEVLFVPNTKFRVLRVEKVLNKAGDKIKQATVVLEEVL